MAKARTRLVVRPLEGEAKSLSVKMTVKDMLKAKLIAPGEITIDWHRTKPDRITATGRLKRDGFIDYSAAGRPLTPNGFVQFCLRDCETKKCNPFHVLFMDNKSLSEIRGDERHQR